MYPPCTARSNQTNTLWSVALTRNHYGCHISSAIDVAVWTCYYDYDGAWI